MLSKTRTTILALAASASMAAAALAPAVSQAQPIKPGTKAALCEVLRLTAGLWHEAAEAAEEKGEADLASYYNGQAEKAEGEAGNRGCQWEITIDATKAASKTATKVKAIKTPGATVPVKGKVMTAKYVAARVAASLAR